MNTDFWIKALMKNTQIPFICVLLWLKMNFKTLPKTNSKESM